MDWRVVSLISVLAFAGCVQPPRMAYGPLPSEFMSTPEGQAQRAQQARYVARSKPERRAPRPIRQTPLLSKVIVVDAGHGGKKPGTIGVGPLIEKDVNLAIARELVDELEQLGASVHVTRSSDTHVELDARAARGERVHADLFISIHGDACDDPKVTGATVYIARGASSQSRRAGRAISDALTRNSIASRGVKTDVFRVLIGHSRPAVLVETGFLTNYAEAQRLADPSHQSRVAEAIAEGVDDALGS